MEASYQNRRYVIDEWKSRGGDDVAIMVTGLNLLKSTFARIFSGNICKSGFTNILHIGISNSFPHNTPKTAGGQAGIQMPGRQFSEEGWSRT